MFAHAPLPKDEADRLQALRSLNQLDTPLEERFERITRIARRLFQTDIAALSLLDGDRQWFKSIQGLDIAETGRDVAFCAHTIVAESGLLYVPDASKDDRFAQNPLVTGEPGISMYAGAVVRAADGKSIGSLCVIDRNAREFAAEDLELLRDLAAIAESELCAASACSVQASLVENMMDEQQTRLIDDLTRLWNREGGRRALAEHLLRLPASSEGVAVAVLDLDRFKITNDSHGHDAGDAVLCEAARRMLSGLRDADLAARTGGDEFTIVLGGCDSPDRARAVLNRVRSKVSDSGFSHKGSVLPISASIGAVWLPGGTTASVDEVLGRVEAELHRCKQAGRGRVSVLDASPDAARAPQAA